MAAGNGVAQVDDFRAEAMELHRFLAGLAPADWARETQFKRWTVNDVVQHLHMGDMLAHASATDVAAYDALVADIAARRAAGMTRLEETRERLAGLAGPALLARWWALAGELCDALAAMDPASRLKWAGPGMGLRMFATARQMETWAHGQAIYDVMGVDRPAASPRLRSVAEIGVRTYGWTFRNRGMEPPGATPAVQLAAPGGGLWEWDGEGGEVRGDALEFCQVVTQTRNVADTSLAVSGAAARAWMNLAQCFAGPPETPPPAGSRFRLVR